MERVTAAKPFASSRNLQGNFFCIMAQFLLIQLLEEMWEDDFPQKNNPILVVGHNASNYGEVVLSKPSVGLSRRHAPGSSLPRDNSGASLPMGPGFVGPARALGWAGLG